MAVAAVPRWMPTHEQIDAELRRRGIEPTQRPIWPAPYNKNTVDSAWKFVTECWWTHNEADQQVALVPAKDYLRWFTGEWHDALTARQPFVCEKSRRLVISWIMRGLETHQLGLQRGEEIIIDQTNANSAEHLWRIHFALDQLRDRRPDIMRVKHEERGATAVKAPTHIILPNGSMITQGHQEAGSEQGKGKSIVVLEELSKYQDPAGFWGQAIIVTQGAATGQGGWVCGVCNASPNDAWRKIKEEENARKFIGLE